MRSGRAAARVPLGRPYGGARLTIVLVLVIGLVCYGDAYAQQPSGDVSAIERQTLIEFFAATGGERWKNHDGWGTTTPVCNWYGVFCDFVDGVASRPFVAGLSFARSTTSRLRFRRVSVISRGCDRWMYQQEDGHF